jgi:hypothetical protein
MEQKSILKNIFSSFLENCGHGRGGLWVSGTLATPFTTR